MVARFVSHHNDRVDVVFILAVFNDNVVQILTHDIGCETRHYLPVYDKLNARQGL